MKILIASPHLRFPRAGGSVFPYSLAKGFAQAGHEVILLGLSLRKDETHQHIQELNYDVGSVKVKWLDDPVKRGWGRYPTYEGYRKNEIFQKECESFIEENRPDILVVNSFNRMGVLVECAYAKDVPVSYIACDLGSSCLNEVGLYELNDKRCYGPAEDKCIQCQMSQFTWLRFFISRFFRIFMKLGII